MDFDTAAENIKNLTTRPNDDELLELYGLYKQATVGDINIDQPGMFDVKGKAKWEAWSSCKGVSEDDAKEKYVALVEQMVEKYGLQSE